MKIQTPSVLLSECPFRDKSFMPEGLCTLDRIMSTISRVEHESPNNRLYLILVIIRMEDKKIINAIG